MTFKLCLFSFALSFSAIGAAQAYTYGNYGNGSSAYISRYYGGSSGSYSSAWRGSTSGYVRNFGSSNGGGYFGVPNGSSIAGSGYISRKHRGQYQAKLRRARLEEERLNNAPPPCGTYGRSPFNCPVQRHGSLSQ